VVSLVYGLVIGMVIYFTYGVKYSKVRNSQPKYPHSINSRMA